MSELEWVKEFRHWIKDRKTEESASRLAGSFSQLRQNLVPLNSELKELNSNAKESKELLAKLAKLQQGVENQTNWLIALTIVMIVFGALQLILAYLTWMK